jgi:YfiH family protein
MIRWDGDHLAVELNGARGVFTTRRGGVSEAPYATLNLGDHVGDAPSAVAENRERVAAIAERPWPAFRHARQVHGATVAGDAERIAEADGQATADPAAAPIVFVADCLPVLLAAEGAVAALHCGWRPLAGGIVAEGVRALRELGADGPVHSVIGPGARGCCYEVGEEVHEHFADVPGARAGERNLDLPAIAAAKLAEAGVSAVHDSGLCTMCRNDLFFSHRADKGVTGRQAGVVWRA